MKDNKVKPSRVLPEVDNSSIEWWSHLLCGILILFILIFIAVTIVLTTSAEIVAKVRFIGVYKDQEPRAMPD